MQSLRPVLGVLSPLARQQLIARAALPAGAFAGSLRARTEARPTVRPLSSSPSPQLASPSAREAPSASSAREPPAAPAQSPAPRRPPSRLQASLAQIRALAHRHGSDPASLVASFLVLHELTALLPLLLLFWIFQVFGAGQAFLAWLGEDDAADLTADGTSHGGFKAMVNGWVQEGMRRAERVGRRYGLFGLEKREKDRTRPADGESAVSNAQSVALVGSFANAVAAYACVKALIPLRLGASVALAPAFARYTIEPIKRLTARWRGRRPEGPAGRSTETSRKQ